MKFEKTIKVSPEVHNKILAKRTELISKGDGHNVSISDTIKGALEND